MLHGFQADHVLVHTLVEVPVLVQHIGDAAAHTGGKVLAGLAQYDHRAAGHVLAAVVAHTLDNGHSAGVAHAEALAGHAVDKGLAAGSAVQRHVADNDILAAVKGDFLGRIHDELAAGQALAEIVVGVAHQFQRQAAWG